MRHPVMLLLALFMANNVRNGALKGYWKDMRIAFVLMWAWIIVYQGYLHLGWFGGAAGVAVVGGIAWGCIQLAKPRPPKEKPPRFV